MCRLSNFRPLYHWLQTATKPPIAFHHFSCTTTLPPAFIPSHKPTSVSLPSLCKITTTIALFFAEFVREFDSCASWPASCFHWVHACVVFTDSVSPSSEFLFILVTRVRFIRKAKLFVFVKSRLCSNLVSNIYCHD